MMRFWLAIFEPATEYKASLSKDDDDGNEDVISKYNFSFFVTL